jgi:hypothetical protein
MVSAEIPPLDILCNDVRGIFIPLPLLIISSEEREIETESV